MFGKQMIALQSRKKALLLESDLNRLRLQAEINNLREFANFSKRFKHVGRLGGMTGILGQLSVVAATLGLGGSPLAGGVIRKILVAAPALMRLWRTVSALLAGFR